MSVQNAPAATLTPSAERANGLATYFSVLTSPTAAFDQLRRTPMWGWAAIATLVIVVAAGLLLLPATVHTTQLLDQQILAHATADQKAQMQATFARQNPGALWKPFVNSSVGMFISWLFVALIALLAASAGGSDAKFKLAWVTAVNASLPGVLGQLVNALIIYFRGAQSVNSFADLNALPSLAALAGQNQALGAFLGAINPFQIWYAIILAIGIQHVMAAKKSSAVAAAIIVWFLGALMFAGLAAVSGLFMK